MDAWLQSFNASNTGNLDISISYCFVWLVVLLGTSRGDTLVWHYFDAFWTDRKGMQSKLWPSDLQNDMFHVKEGESEY